MDFLWYETSTIDEFEDAEVDVASLYWGGVDCVKDEIEWEEEIGDRRWREYIANVGWEEEGDDDDDDDDDDIMWVMWILWVGMRCIFKRSATN